jgi:uncharacterized protein (DUF433 family)
LRGRDIKAKEVLEDIKSGMSAAGLMKKYRISSRGLNDLYRQLSASGLLRYSPVIKISMNEIAADIRQGMSFSQLMHKYHLPPHGLQDVLDQLLDAKAVGLEELNGALQLRYQSVIPENIRLLPRHCLYFEVPVCVAGAPEFRGLVRDVTEKGVGLTGIAAEIDQTKTMIILGDELGQVEPFELEARCRWFEGKGRHKKSGYEITKISQKHLRELRRLIRLANFGESVRNTT